MKYILKNEEIEVCIDSFGAQLCSFKDLNEGLEYLWQADEKYWARHSPILFPIVGKLLDDEYSYKDKIYSMSQHGFARDMPFSLFEKSEDYLCFKLENNEDTLKKYPFEFDLYLAYKIENRKLTCSYKVVNKTKGEMLFSIGAHPAFNWPLEDEEKEKYYFEFENTKKLERVPLTPLGVSFEKKVIELKDNKLFINENLFCDDALVLQNLENKTITLKNTQNNRFVKVDFEGFEYLGLWSKPTGAPFVCIEPWHGIADFITHDKKFEVKKGLKKLLENEVFTSNYSISI